MSNRLMPWSIAECTARDASPTSIEPYMVVLISQVPKPMGEVMRSVFPIGRRSMPRPYNIEARASGGPGRSAVRS